MVSSRRIQEISCTFLDYNDPTFTHYLIKVRPTRKEREDYKVKSSLTMKTKSSFVSSLYDIKLFDNGDINKSQYTLINML